MLAELGDLKEFLGIADTTTSEDDKLEMILSGVDAAVKRYCNRDLESRTYSSELYSGHGHDILYLKQRPLTAVSSLKVAVGGYGGVGNSDAFTADTAWTQNTDYILGSTDEDEHNMAEIIAIRTNFPAGKRNVQVTYTAGYTTVPADIKLAVLQLCAAIRSTAKQGHTLQSERLGDYSYQILSTQNTPDLIDARRKLNHYRNPCI